MASPEIPAINPEKTPQQVLEQLQRMNARLMRRAAKVMPADTSAVEGIRVPSRLDRPTTITISREVDGKVSFPGRRHLDSETEVGTVTVKVNREPAPVNLARRGGHKVKHPIKKAIATTATSHYVEEFDSENVQKIAEWNEHIGPSKKTIVKEQVEFAKSKNPGRDWKKLARRGIDTSVSIGKIETGSEVVPRVRGLVGEVSIDEQYPYGNVQKPETNGLSPQATDESLVNTLREIRNDLAIVADRGER